MEKSNTNMSHFTCQDLHAYAQGFQPGVSKQILSMYSKEQKLFWHAKMPLAFCALKNRLHLRAECRHAACFSRRFLTKSSQKQPKIEWCCRQKRGIQIIEQNNILSQKYMEQADKCLEAVALNKGEWKVITAYYACYNALYSLLMNAGIKCEIHECTIEIAAVTGGFGSNDIDFIKNLKSDRIDVQYYLKERELDDEAKVKSFVFKCKELLNSLDFTELRNKILEHIKNAKR